MGKEYKTAEKYAEAETIIEKSRFIGYVQPVDNEDQAEAFVSMIKSRHKDATHNVPVYLIGEDYKVQRYSDDGEPSGTAGIPVLEMLKKEGITNIAMVITRYFGGIKLGTGGLVRAYTNAAKLALDHANIIKKIEHQLNKVNIDYTFLGKVQSELLNKGYIIKDIEFSDHVGIFVYSQSKKTSDLHNILVDLTNGQCHIESLNLEYISFKNGQKV